jgi:SHS2 domain-containing protein
MNYQFEILEHPADIRLKVTALSKKGLFRGALKGMASIINGQECLKEEIIEKKIEILSLDEETLLVDFLNEVLAQTDIYNSVFSEIKIEEFTSQKIRGKIKGHKVERFKEEIKGVTYHGLDIIKNKKGLWEVIILFDI